MNLLEVMTLLMNSSEMTVNSSHLPMAVCDVLNLVVYCGKLGEITNSAAADKSDGCIYLQ